MTNAPLISNNSAAALKLGGGFCCSDLIYMNDSVKGHLSMLGANVMWGLMSPISKFVMIGGLVSPLVVTDLRMGGAMLLFWLLSFFSKPEHVGHKDLACLFGASLLGIVFNQGCFIFGVSLSSPGDASIITTSMPLWAMVLAAFVLKEPITGKKVLGIAAGAAGALLLIIGGRSVSGIAGNGSAVIWGDILVVLAQLCYALYIVVYKDFVSKYSFVTIMKWMFTYAFICTVPFSARSLSQTHWGALSGIEWASLAFIVVCGTFLSYMLVVIGQKYLRPTVAGMYNYIQPLVACIVAICWGMDHFTIVKALAALLIFGGVYLVTASRTRKEVETYEAAREDQTADR